MGRILCVMCIIVKCIKADLIAITPTVPVQSPWKLNIGRYEEDVLTLFFPSNHLKVSDPY